MSADLWLEIDTGGPEAAQVGRDWNITYNLTPMLREAGYPGHAAMLCAPCSEAGGVFRSVAETLKADPERFRKLNPPNGWGDFDLAVEFCEGMAAECASHPRAVVAGSL